MWWGIGLVQCSPPSDVAGVTWRRIGHKPMTQSRIRAVSRKEQIARHLAFAVQRRNHLTALLLNIGDRRSHVIAIIRESRPKAFRQSTPSVGALSRRLHGACGSNGLVGGSSPPGSTSDLIRTPQQRSFGGIA